MGRYVYWVVVLLLCVASIGIAFLVTESKEHIIYGIVIPHHDIVAPQRQEFLRIVSKKIQPQTIILVSPNHYDVGHADIQTVDQDWKLSGGGISSNSTVVQSLIRNNIGNEPNSFIDEHGIHLVLADIHRSFPRASLVPVIIKSTTTQKEIESLGDVLMKSCEKCLMISSVDFSHYQPAMLGNLHDELSIRALENIDEHMLFTQAEVDSPGTLMLLAKWVNIHSAKHFELWKHTNSGELLKQPDIESTTHVFGWYEAGAPVQPKNSVTFLIGGDAMLGRMIAHTFLQEGMQRVFDQFGERSFWGVDAGIINLEGPISKHSVDDDYNSKDLIFNFPPQAIDALKFLRINGASLANNHSANAGLQGVQNTRSVLMKANIQPIGGPGNQDIPQVGIFPGQGMRLVVIGIHALYTPSDISELIKNYKKDPNNRVMIFPHWGVEYSKSHTATQERLAHAWIDAGADIVIGSHPHVIEDSEMYKGKPIIYSLGNFVFDQNFSKDTQEGLVVGGEFTDKGLTLFGLPIQMKNYQPSFIRGAEKYTILHNLHL